MSVSLVDMLLSPVRYLLVCVAMGSVRVPPSKPSVILCLEPSSLEGVSYEEVGQ